MNLEQKFELLALGLQRLQEQRSREAAQLEQTEGNILRQEGAIMLIQQLIAETTASATEGLEDDAVRDADDEPSGGG